MTHTTDVAQRRDFEKRISLLERLMSKNGRYALPGRLSVDGIQVTDWDTATYVGYYWSDDGWVGHVLHGPGQIVQERIRQTSGGTQKQRRAYDGANWSTWQSDGGPQRGTSTERAATRSSYWDMWQDTDGSQLLYVGNKSGGWRQYQGTAAVPDKAWDATAAPAYGRSDTLTIPTVLEPNEYLAITPISLGTGYATLGAAALVRNPTNTTLVTRLMQFMNSATQSYTFAWQIVQGG
ncbi:hypothetical protein PBI_DEWDROP_80 [Microbacterium phage Dewdrop]|nr:hypothetical protein PBI_LEAF_80 [Microbacterium phage Leaf]QGZ17448.1 hypothetical protein PBI_DEWDROP_80 [Microbacterium phage Dewdrop]